MWAVLALLLVLAVFVLDGVAAAVAAGVAVVGFFAACIYAVAGESEGISRGGP